MRARNFLSYLWTIFMIFIVLTWVLWFFGYDIRDIRNKIKEQYIEIKAKAALSAHLQPKTDSEINIDTSSQVSPTKDESVKKEKALINKCEDSFNNCAWIANQKFGFTVSIIKSQYFKDRNGMDEFVEVWGGDSPTKLEDPLSYASVLYKIKWKVDDNLPIVLMATKIEKEDIHLPTTVICNKDGELIEYSKKVLSCG